LSWNLSPFFGLQYKADFLVKRYKELLGEIFTLCYRGHLGGIGDILDLSVNDRIILLDVLLKTRNEEKAEQENQGKI